MHLQHLVTLHINKLDFTMVTCRQLLFVSLQKRGRLNKDSSTVTHECAYTTRLRKVLHQLMDTAVPTSLLCDCIDVKFSDSHAQQPHKCQRRISLMQDTSL